MSDPLILYRTGSIDAEAAKELLLERWPNAEVIADTEVKGVIVTDDPPNEWVVEPTTDACVAMQVWWELHPCRDKQHPGPRIREGRKMRGLTTGELALKCGVSASAVSQWELQRADPSEANVMAACAALGVRAPWVYGVSDSQEGGWPQADPPTWLRYLDDAVCGRWRLTNSKAVWAWMQMVRPLEMAASGGHDGDPTMWAWAGHAILCARERWEAELEGLRGERDGFARTILRLDGERRRLKSRCDAFETQLRTRAGSEATCPDCKGAGRDTTKSPPPTCETCCGAGTVSAALLVERLEREHLGLRAELQASKEAHQRTQIDRSATTAENILLREALAWAMTSVCDHALDEGGCDGGWEDNCPNGEAWGRYCRLARLDSPTDPP